jgi:hypothetical protein
MSRPASLEFSAETAAALSTISEVPSILDLEPVSGVGHECEKEVPGGRLEVAPGSYSSPHEVHPAVSNGCVQDNIDSSACSAGSVYRCWHRGPGVIVFRCGTECDARHVDCDDVYDLIHECSCRRCSAVLSFQRRLFLLCDEGPGLLGCGTQFIGETVLAIAIRLGGFLIACPVEVLPILELHLFSLLTEHLPKVKSMLTGHDSAFVYSEFLELMTGCYISGVRPCG